MDARQGEQEPGVGAPVVDAAGQALGRVRHVYPHYLVVEEDGLDPAAFRVPRRALAGFDGATLSLSVPRDALDPMTPSDEVFDEAPETGGAFGD